jgi:uncharacterized protein YciI
MPHYLIRLRPSRPEMPVSPTPEEAEIVGRHFEYLKAAKETGKLFMAGRTITPPFIGIAVFEADDDAAAEAFLSGDPAIQEGVFNGSVQPFGLAIS